MGLLSIYVWLSPQEHRHYNKYCLKILVHIMQNTVKPYQQHAKENFIVFIVLEELHCCQNCLTSSRSNWVPDDVGRGAQILGVHSDTSFPLLCVCMCSRGTLKPTISAITEKLPHVNNMMWWDVKRRRIKVHTLRLKDKFSVFPVWSSTHKKKIFNLWLQMLVACRRKAKTDKKNAFQNICVCVRP